MARKPRIHLPGGLYHVILRGNGGLALQAEDIPLSNGMQSLALRFTRWINWREKRTGLSFPAN
jgi:putative transposase